MSLPTLTTSGQSLHALLLALDYRLGSKKKQKKNIPVSVSRAQRGGAPPSDPPLKFRRPVCVSISREHKGELLQHMETEMDGENEKVLSEDGATSRAEKRDQCASGENCSTSRRHLRLPCLNARLYIIKKHVSIANPVWPLLIIFFTTTRNGVT